MRFRNWLLGVTLVCATVPAFAKDKAVAATVNGTPIYEEQIDAFANAPGNPNRSQVLNELINQELVYQDAIARGLDKDKEVQKELEQLRKRVLMSAAVQSAVGKTPVTDKELKAEYEKRKPQLARKEYKARHILVDSKDKAESLIKDLGKGGKFAELASKHSTDPGSKNGGDLGWFPAEQMVPPFAAALRSLQKGEYTKSPVQTQFGWHVVLLEDTREVPAPAFDDIKERLRGMLQQQRVAQYLEKLQAKAKVDVKAAEKPAAAAKP